MEYASRQVEHLFRKTGGDRYIWLVVIFLSIISMLAVYSSTGSLAFKYQGGNMQYYLVRQFGMILLAIFLMYIAHKINYTYYSRIAQLLLYVSVPLLFITLIFGVEINDARRWLTIPVVGISFQTSDLAKLGLIMYTARALAKNQGNIKDFKTGFLPVMLPSLIICGLIAPSNLSTAAILFATCLLLMFIGRVNMKYIAIMALAGIMLLAIIIVIAELTSFHARVDTWISRIHDFTGGGEEQYQVQQAKIAIAHGGIFGVGPGNSIQRNFLPSPYSDFIYAIIIEEYGFIGALVMVLLYLFFLLRCIKIFVKCPGAFGAFLAVGLSFGLVVQALINMAVVVHLLPTTGVTLPFVSMGGTSLWFTSIAIGIILSVSRNVEEEKKKMSRQQRRVIISGGGTGGHIFPAIAIANALKKMDATIEILFVGALERMEMEKIPKAGYKIEGLPISGLQRKLDWRNLLLPFKVINSIMKARTIVKQFKPDVAVGVGGYASAPLLYAASNMKIPSLIQEQNCYAGITNKRLSRRVQKICVAYEGMEKFFPKEKLMMTGNPVRKDILNLESKREEGLKYFGLSGDQKILLVIGGSLGARTINDSVRENLDEISNAGVQLLWQTGKNYYEVNAEAAKNSSEQIKVHAFIDRMDLAYAVADVVISRAGALSIAELCIAKKPSILVPSPNVAEDHQTKNALALVNKNAAIIVKDGEAKTKLVKEVLNLILDPSVQQTLKINIASLAKPNADDDIAKEVLKLIK